MWDIPSPQGLYHYCATANLSQDELIELNNMYELGWLKIEVDSLPMIYIRPF